MTLVEVVIKTSVLCKGYWQCPQQYLHMNTYVHITHMWMHMKKKHHCQWGFCTKLSSTKCLQNMSAEVIAGLGLFWRFSSFFGGFCIAIMGLRCRFLPSSMFSFLRNAFVSFFSFWFVSLEVVGHDQALEMHHLRAV